MKTVVINLNEEDFRELEVLCDFLNESISEVIKRGITILFDRTFHPANPD